jgi:hypothetical protein
MKPMEGVRALLRLCGKTFHAVLRGIGWLFLIVVVAGAGLAWYASRSFSPENARRMAIDQLTALLHREVAIDHLVLSPRGLKVVGIRVRRGKQGDADLLTCDSAIVTIKLRPLMQRRLEFDTVLLQSPQISLTRDEQGDWDLADVFGSTSTRRGAALPLAMAAAQTIVEDGVLRIDDRLRRRKLSFDRLRLRVDGFELDKAFPVSISFRTADTFGGRTLTATAEAEGRVDLASLRWSSATATADRLRVEVEGVPLSGRATVVGFSSPVVEVSAAAPPLGPEDWRHLFGRSAPLNLPSSRWTLKAEIPAPAMVEIEKLSVETPAGAATATGVFDFAADTPTLSVELTARDAELSKAGSWLPSTAPHRFEGRATLRASVTGWWGNLTARDADLSLRGFGGVWDDRKLEGIDADLSAADEFAKLKATVTKGRATAAGNDFEDIVLAATLDKQNLSVDHLNLRWGGSKVRLRARVEHPTAPKEVALSGSVDKIDWPAAARLVNDVRAAISTRTATAADSERPWLRTFKYSIPRGFPDTTGHVRVGEVTHPLFNFRDVDLLWTLHGVTPELDHLTGEARLAFGPGRVSDIPALQTANRFMSVVFLPFIFMHKMNSLSVFSGNTAYPKSLDFARIDGEYGAAKGVATIRYFHVDSPQLVAYTEGTADLAHEKVDMNILTRLTSYRGTLPEWWVDEDGNPAIGFRVKGDINKPDLEPRFRKIGHGEMEQTVDEARRHATERFRALEKSQTLP